MHLAFNLSRQRFHRFINSTLRAKYNARLRLAFALQKLASYLSAKPDGSWGWGSAVDSEGRTIWIADAHRGGGKRLVVRADEKLIAFLELESTTLSLRSSAAVPPKSAFPN
jgi:hypothetical protein